MKLASAALLFLSVLSGQQTAQQPGANPLTRTAKAIYEISKADVLGSIDAIPENLWSYQPTKDVRTVGELFAHIAARSMSSAASRLKESQ